MKAILLFAICGCPYLLLGQTYCVSPEEKKLYDMIMQYRKTKKLKAIPYSEKLTRVAQAHARDLTDYFDYENRGDCNPHSWSERGSWSACCYTADHALASCMWSKPKEIAAYESEGYEIAYYSSAGANAVEGLDGWKKSSGHNPLLINSGSWKKLEWKGIGIGICGPYAVVWFGTLANPSKIEICN